MKYFKIYFPLLLLISFFSCDVINPEEDIPAYVEILPFEYVPEQGGLNSSKITDGWFYVNGEFLGAFDLPKTIPVLQEGTHDIIVDPGIKENGINNTPNIYPFYERYTTTVNLVRGEVTTIQPTTTYDENTATIVFEEDFEGSDNKFTSEITNVSTEVGEGNGSGFFALNKDNLPSLTFFSIQVEEFPIQNGPAFLEVDYKTDVPIFFGVAGFDLLGQQTVAALDFGVNAKDEWNKVYFNYTDIMRTMDQNNTQFYQIRVSAQIPTINGEFTMENAEIRLDNIKLVVF